MSFSLRRFTPRLEMRLEVALKACPSVPVLELTGVLEKEQGHLIMSLVSHIRAPVQQQRRHVATKMLEYDAKRATSRSHICNL